jgi:hypothetical protein
MESGKGVKNSQIDRLIAVFTAAIAAAIALALLMQLTACGPPKAVLKRTGDTCLFELKAQTESKPVLTHLTTLDQQQVPLADFYRLSRRASSPCALPEKFYYWKSEIKWVTDKTPRREIVHQIRLYHNYLSTCRPDLVDPGKTYGDVAEFYNENGDFMGLVVYAGKGLYCPLPYTKYSAPRNRLPYHAKNDRKSVSK